jgi:hypothetical protein
MDVKKALLNVAEESVKQAWLQVVKPLLEEKVKASATQIDDAAFSLLIGTVESELLKAIDKIDGAVG